MFKRLKQFLTGAESNLEIDSSGEETSRELHVATGILLLEMAGSDGDYAPEEVQTIFTIMKREFDLTEDEVADLLEIADLSREKKGKIDEFIQLINQNFSEAQRGKILEMVWRVILADQQIEKFERRFAAQIKSRLQLSDEVNEAAKQAAEKASSRP